MAETTLVLGASSDIGIALCRALLNASSEAHLLAHSFRGGERLSVLTTEFPGRVDLLTADLSDAAAADALALYVLSRHGQPANVVHLPALQLHYERFTKFDWEHFEQDLAVQVRSLVIILKRLLPKMVKLPRGRIVFMLTSNVHGDPPRFMSQYTMVKYTQLGMMRALAAEYAATPLRINAVSPSMVETKFLGELSDHVIEGAAASHPLGRNAKPEDVVGAIQYLLSPAADNISGYALPVAGGAVV